MADFIGFGQPTRYFDRPELTIKASVLLATGVVGTVYFLTKD